MDLTKEALNELNELNNERKKYFKERDEILGNVSIQWDYKRPMLRKIDSETDKLESKQDKIKKLGVSSSQLNKVKNELKKSYDKVLIHSEKDITGTSFSYVMYSKTLNSYIKIGGTKYSSLAYKSTPTEIESIALISQEIFEEIKKGIAEAGAKRTAYFSGATQVMRNEQIIPRRQEENLISPNLIFVRPYERSD